MLQPGPWRDLTATTPVRAGRKAWHGGSNDSSFELFEHGGSNDSSFELFEHGGSNGSGFELFEHGSLGMVSYVYICRALPTTWNIVFNLLNKLPIDLILVAAQQLSLVTRPD